MLNNIKPKDASCPVSHFILRITSALIFIKMQS